MAPRALAYPTLAMLVLGRPSSLASAQRPDNVAKPARVADRATVDRYEPVFDALRHMAPRGDSVATVRTVRLRRDVIDFQLDEGKLYLTTPVAGRTIGAIFIGHGSVAFAPPPAVERRELERLLGDSVLHARISAAAFVFTDSTVAELSRQLSFDGRGVVGEVSGTLTDALARVIDDDQVLQPTLITTLMNGDTNGFFYAHVKRERGEDLMFVVDPAEEDQVELLRRGRLEGQKIQVVCQFKATRAPGERAVALDGGDPLKVNAYRIEATIAKGLAFSATATVELTARRGDIGWVRFDLLSALAVDSVRREGSGGGPLTFTRAGKSGELWVRFDTPLGVGETRALRVRYHGDLVGYSSVIDNIQRYWPAKVRGAVRTALDQWLYVKTPTTWFPRYGALQPADVDLTFHTPKRYHFATIGRLIESRVDGDVQTSHWHTVVPADQVCFSLGEFEEFKITDPRIPPVTVHVNAEAHRRLDEFFRALRDELDVPWDLVATFLSPRDPQQDVGADVANSLAFFSAVFGRPPFDQYYAAEIPFAYGEAFPGLIYLPVWTFQAVSDSGYDEILRAHEMAHQWWGIGVEPAGYRDWWLSEGFAEFSGLWYMQRVLKDNEKFFRHLRHWRREIRGRRDEAPPIGIGSRAAQLSGRDYTLTTYYKGAWVLQMLRNLMLDFRGMNEDAFTAMMRDFYREYKGRRASTEDFQKVVERHVGIDMTWFFDEWVRGTAIPTYVLSWRAEPAQNGHYTLQLRVRQEDVPKSFLMPVPVKVGFAGQGESR